MPKPPTPSNNGNGGNPGNGIGRFFTKAMYRFEHTIRAVSAGSVVLPPSDPRADINDLTASATAPAHRRSYDPVVGGYYRFAASSSQKFDLATGFANNIAEVFIAMLVRRRTTTTTNNGCFARYTSGAAVSLGLFFDATQVYGTMSGTVGTVNAPGTIATHAGKWHLAMLAYRASGELKVGIDGYWVNTQTFAANTLNNHVALGIGVNPATALAGFDGDIAFVGIGTSIPTDRQVKQIAATLLNGADVPGGTNDPPGGGGGGTPPPDPGTIPVGSGLLLRGVG